MCIALLPSVLVSLSIGPWSDRYGRRLPLIMPSLGMCLSALNMLLLHYWRDAPIAMLFLSPLVESCAGGVMTLLTAALAYGADISVGDARTIRFALVDLSLWLGMAVGGVVSSQIIASRLVPSVVYLAYLASGLLALIYALFRIRETVIPPEQTSAAEKLAYLWQFRHVADGFRAIARPRAGARRRRVCLLIAAASVIFFVEIGQIPIQQPFLEFPPFTWPLAYYMRVGAARQFLFTAAIGIFVLLCKRHLHWLDSSLGIIGCLSGIFLSVGFGVARSSLLIYAAYVIGLLELVATIALRAIVSDSIEVDEQAQVFAVLAANEALTALIGGLFYSALFSTTIHIFWSGFSFMVSAFLLLGPLIIFCFVDIDIRCSNSDVDSSQSSLVG